MEERRTPAGRAGLVAGELLLGVGRLAWRALPEAARRRLEQRFFGAVFQVTRVTNDAYGWRPEDERPGAAPGEGAEKPGKREDS